MIVLLLEVLVILRYSIYLRLPQVTQIQMIYLIILVAGINTSLGYGTRDPFNTLVVKINNNDRFTETDATFFRTMQPYKYHSNIPGGITKASKKQYIYVYSFALNPEEYQPTKVTTFRWEMT